MTLKEVLKAGCDRLRVAGIDEARTECEHMLMQLLNLNRAQLLYRISSELRSTAEAPTEQQQLRLEQEKQFFAWIQAREKRIPLAYLLGDVFFYSLKLKVEPGCLIPRPETELLVDSAVSALSLRYLGSEPAAQPQIAIADIGCGSGAIALALLSEIKDARAVLLDVSGEALEIARTNARELNFEQRAEFILSDLFANLPQDRKFDLIVSNPPYLTHTDMQTLQPELTYEPRLALDGGLDGMDFYRRIIHSAADYLKPGGFLGFELGAGQAAEVCEELKRSGYGDLKVFKDHQLIERVVLASAPVSATGAK